MFSISFHILLMEIWCKITRVNFGTGLNQKKNVQNSFCIEIARFFVLFMITGVGFGWKRVLPLADEGSIMGKDSSSRYFRFVWFFTELK